MLWNVPVPPADLIAPSPGYRSPAGLGNRPPTPLWQYMWFTLAGGRNIGSNVRNDVAGSVT